MLIKINPFKGLIFFRRMYICPMTITPWTHRISRIIDRKGLWLDHDEKISGSPKERLRRSGGTASLRSSLRE